MEDNLKAILGRIATFSEAEWDEIWSCFSVKKIASKNLITKIGDVEKNIYFIVDGVLRLYCFNPKDEEVTIYLFKENHFASCLQSFLTQSESDQALESITDCTLLAIEKTKIEDLYKSIPQMNLVTRVISEQRFLNSQRIFTSQIMYTPEERYLKFEKEHGNLLLRVPHHIISSFLGITPVSMSRIRRRIIQK